MNPPRVEPRGPEYRRATVDVAPTRPGRERSLLVAAVLIVLIGLGVVAMPRAQKLESAEGRSVTIERLRKIYAGLGMYMADTDGFLPPHLGDAHALQAKLHPYLSPADVFVSGNPSGGFLVGNQSLSATEASVVDKPWDTPVLHETKAWRDGTAAVMMVGGTIRFVEDSQLRQAVQSGTTLNGLSMGPGPWVQN